MVLFLAGAGTAGAAERHRQVIRGYVVPKGTVGGPLPGDRTLHLTITLEALQRAALAQLAADVSDPRSVRFRQYLTLEELKARFSPTEADVRKVVDWAQAHHLTVVEQSGNRMLVMVRGRAADVEPALAVKLGLARRADGSEFYKPDRAPSLDLDVAIAHVGGVDDHFVPRRHGGSLPNWSASGAHDLRRAYAAGCWGLRGRNEAVGITAYGGYNHADIAAYQSFNNLPDSTAAGCGQGAPGSGPCLVDVMVGGFNGAINAWSDEATMDVEMAVAMAPGMRQVTVFEADPLADHCGTAILARMASTPGIKQFSTSNGVCKDAATKASLDLIAAMGATFFAASGDGGGALNLDAGTFYPVWATRQVDVGGTVLEMTGAGISWLSEQAWRFSGGGVETYTSFPATCPAGCTPGTTGCPDWCLPPWQANIGAGASTQYRNDPDVAMAALNVYCKLASGPSTCCGTSISAPLWAGFMALINEQRCLNDATRCGAGAGFIAPFIYDIGRDAAVYPTAFHDITSNSSDATCPFSGQSLSAGPGYDHATGWGSPRCGLVAQFACTFCTGSTASPGTAPSPACVNFQEDNANCGSCGHACPGNLVCMAGQCLPPGTVGDTHVTTLDGLFYDFQAQGDFFLISTSPAFVVQTRQVSGAPTWPDASVNQAVAIRMGERRIAFFIHPHRILADGQPAALDDGKALALSGGVAITRAGSVYTVTSLAGETVRVTLNPGYLNVVVGLGYSPGGAARGLLGNGNGRPDDDILGLDGKVLPQPVSFDDLYRVFGESLRVQPRDSLFGDEKGMAFAPPARPFYASDLESALSRKARAACTGAGVKAGALLDACTLDVAVIGTPQAAQSFVGAPAPAAVMQPGQRPPRTGCGCGPAGAGSDGGLIGLLAALLGVASPLLRRPSRRTGQVARKARVE